MSKFRSEVRRFVNSPIWAYFIPVPSGKADGLVGKNRRVRCSINSTEPIQLALMHDGSGGFFINLNKALMKKLKLAEHDKVDISLAKDESRYGMATPLFFEELCHQTPIGAKYFHQLTAGKQRTLLHVISKLKSEQKQLEKAMVILDYLENSSGKLDFKALNVAFKNSRFKF